MKKKQRKLLIPVTLLIAAFLCTGTGCGSGRDADAEEEYRTQGIEQLENGKYEAAAESFASALENAGRRFGDLELDISYYKGLAEYRSGETAAAIETYTGIMDYDDANYRPYYLRGCVYAQTGETASAVEDFAQAVSMDEDDYELYISIYQTLADTDAEEEGADFLKQALKIEGSDADDWCEKGYIQYLLGHEKKAENYLLEAIDAGNEQAMIYRGLMLADSGDYEEARSWFDQYYEAHSEDADELLSLGETALGCGAADAAEDYFEQAVALTEGEDKNRTARKSLISACEHAGDYDEAYELLEAYVADYPDDEAAAKELKFVKTRI